jgi:hypothetical protein
MIYEYFSNISNPFYQLANIRILLQQKKLIKNYFLGQKRHKKNAETNSAFCYWLLAIGHWRTIANSH